MYGVALALWLAFPSAYIVAVGVVLRLPCGLLPCPCVIIAFGGGVACLVARVSVRLYSSGACGVALALWRAFPSAYIVAVGGG